MTKSAGPCFYTDRLTNPQRLVLDHDYVTRISGRLRVKPGGSHLTARPELRYRFRTWAPVMRLWIEWMKVFAKHRAETFGEHITSRVLGSLPTFEVVGSA